MCLSSSLLVLFLNPIMSSCVVWQAITFETFAWRDPAPPPYTKDFCGMPAGTATQGQLNRPDLARVTGEGQLVAHLSARALAMETMHPVNITGAPQMQLP